MSMDAVAGRSVRSRPVSSTAVHRLDRQRPIGRRSSRDRPCQEREQERVRAVGGGG